MFRSAIGQIGPSVFRLGKLLDVYGNAIFTEAVAEHAPLPG